MYALVSPSRSPQTKNGQAQVTHKLLITAIENAVQPYDNAKPAIINAEAIDGPFEYLTNKWQINYISDNTSEVLFAIDFSFKSKLLNYLVSDSFEKIASKMADAFAERLKVINL